MTLGECSAGWMPVKTKPVLWLALCIWRWFFIGYGNISPKIWTSCVNVRFAFALDSWSIHTNYLYLADLIHILDTHICWKDKKVKFIQWTIQYSVLQCSSIGAFNTMLFYHTSLITFLRLSPNRFYPALKFEIYQKLQKSLFSELH